MAAAHPEWVDALHALERMAESMRAYARANSIPAPLDPLPNPLSLEAVQVAVLREIADGLTAQDVPGPGVATDDSDVHPRSRPDPIPRAAFFKASAMLVAGEPLTDIARATGLHWNQVRKIRDWQAHPGQHGPGGSPGYRLYPGETSATVVLRRLRQPR